MKLWQRNLWDFAGKDLWVKVVDFNSNYYYMKIDGSYEDPKRGGATYAVYQAIDADRIDDPDNWEPPRFQIRVRRRSLMLKRLFDETYHIAKGAIAYSDEDIEELMRTER